MRSHAVALWGSWRPSATADTLALDGHEMIVVEGSEVGCVAVTVEPDHLRVRKLYVGASHRGRGIGAAVLRMVVAAAADRPVRLSVLLPNEGAARFYRREGVVEISRTDQRIWMERAVSVVGV